MNRRLFIRQCSSLALASLPVSLGLAGKALARSPIPQPRPKPANAVAPATIVIDPGHGGVDPGAIGRSGIQEKHVVLEIAAALAQELAGLTQARIKLTRETDIFLSLEDRVAIAESLRADFFVSVHADSAPSADARGMSIYTLSDVASDNLSAALATRENSVDALGGINLRQVDRKVAKILIDLARRETLNQSITAQRRLIADLQDKTRLLERPARAANFAVLRSPSVPAVLVETGFLSNYQDEALLKAPGYRNQLAKIMAHAVADVVRRSVGA